MRVSQSVEEVVTSGLCIGCGLCEALAPERWKMTYTAEGRLRPARIGAGSDSEILLACPGVTAEPNNEDTPHLDDIWGGYHSMTEAWAGDDDIRYRASTGGVLTAVGVHLLQSGKARFILHCAADPRRPMRTSWCLSTTAQEVISRAGSRYGPSDTLSGLERALVRDEPLRSLQNPVMTVPYASERKTTSAQDAISLLI